MVENNQGVILCNDYSMLRIDPPGRFINIRAPIQNYTSK